MTSTSAGDSRTKAGGSRLRPRLWCGTTTVQGWPRIGGSRSAMARGKRGCAFVISIASRDRAWRGAGRIYSPLPFVRSLTESRVHSGVWGTASFPTVYHMRAHAMQALPHRPEWLITSVLVLLAAAGMLASGYAESPSSPSSRWAPPERRSRSSSARSMAGVGHRRSAGSAWSLPGGKSPGLSHDHCVAARRAAVCTRVRIRARLAAAPQVVSATDGGDERRRRGSF
jgi:hypothetical protein